MTMGTVFATGAAGGIGEATVARLLDDGYTVVAADISREGLDALARQHEGQPLHTIAADLTDEQAAREAVRTARREVGQIDRLVNLIGWFGTQPFVQEDSAYWRKTIAINFEALLYVTHEILPEMIERKRGKIVNVTSDAGKVGQSGEAVYSGTKGAVIAWSKSLARENARYGLNINCTAPGPTETALELAQDSDVIGRVIRVIPFRRFAKPAEQAAMISFLCGPDSDFITGQVFSVSGGLTMI
ncbi:SDR family NAD(P)-dependent oxidoreductase [Rhodoligotrophos defluvii]|uniref:SDR family NAD(P)-dependent oxidoreductase n=1 Tax=Rhodoligotrophos defluvii TaxID=2561934 RepID=UPI0010C9D153|nr:SDR family oxidoreductase [Rhodoligotrophos defluvii]